MILAPADLHVGAQSAKIRLARKFAVCEHYTMTLDEFRKARGLSLTALAELFGSKPSTVHGWINGHRRPSWDWLDRIEDRTGGCVRPNDFSPQVDMVHPTNPDAPATEAA